MPYGLFKRGVRLSVGLHYKTAHATEKYDILSP